jgi:hypothetical protein
MNINKFKRAAEQPAEVESALTELGQAFGELAQSTHNLKENLDLIAIPPVEEDPKAHVAAKSKYASKFRRLAEENPDAFANALIEVYNNLDEVAEGVENLADHMGIELVQEPEIPNSPTIDHPENISKTEDMRSFREHKKELTDDVVKESSVE